MSIKTSLVLLISALIISIVFFLVEITPHYNASEFLVLTEKYADLRLYSVGQIAILFLICCAGIHYVIWRALKHNKKDFETDVEINFKYIKNLSFLSDLLIKFSAISLLILAGKGVWISPFMLICLGDYLIQGRLFVIKTRYSIILGILCLTGAVIQYSYHLYTLLIPLGIFISISGISIAYLLSLKFNQKDTRENA